MMSMYSVLDEILFEREHQHMLWGLQDHDPLRFHAILAEEAGEVAKEVVEWAALEHKPKGFLVSEDDAVMEYISEDEIKFELIQKMRKELIQTAAVAVAFIEALDRNH